jgi:hydroxypyruvate isomerase
VTTESPRYAINLSMLFTELPLLQRPAAAKEAGFDAVEFWWPFTTAVPADGQVDEFVGAIGLNFFAGDRPGGDRGLVSWPARSGEFRDNIDVTVGIGERLGCQAFNALYGNRTDESTPVAQEDAAAENLALAAAAVARFDGVVLVEPVSGAPRYPLLTAADVIRVIDRVQAQSDVQNVKFLCDLYHLDANGDNVAAAIENYADRVGHVQIADSPGRGEPGTGRLDIDGHLAALAARGYRGYVALEYKPTVGTRDSLAWLPLADRASNSGTHVG